MTITRNILGALALAGIGFMPGAALADGPQAITTAANHAGLAANAGSIEMVRTHLHHVLNCLVGPGGDGFDAAPGNPCAMAGGGAIPQTTNPEQKTKLLNLANTVKGGISRTNIAEAKKVATDTQVALK